MSDSFWKKEIHLRRKPKVEGPAPRPLPPPEPPSAAASPEPHALPVAVPPAPPVTPVPPAPPTEPATDETLTFDLDRPVAERAAPEPEPVPLPARPFSAEQGVEARRPFVLPAAEAPAVPPVAARPPVEVVTDLTPPPVEKRSRRRDPGAKRSHKTKTIVGLKVGASQLAAARVANNGSAELLQLARGHLEPGIVVAGELRDPDALASALKAFFKEHKLPTRDVRLGLSNNRIGVRTFELEGVDDPDQLKNAIRFRAQETLPIPIDDAVLDYHVLDERVGEDGGLTRRVLLVVAYRDLIDRYVAACRKAGLRLMGIDLEAFALLRALGRAPSEQSEENPVGLVVVSVGHERSTFAVSDGRVCEFARVLDWGGFSLNVAIARALDLRPSEAEPIKVGLSLSNHNVVPAGLTAEMAATARGEVIRALEGFARDLVSSLRFYQSQPGSLAIRELVITGGTAEMPGLANELERLIGVHVRVGDPLGRVKLSKRVDEREHVGSLAAAIGLGIED